MSGPTAWQSASSLTVTEAAAVLGISRTHAYRLIDSGDLPAERDELGRWRVKPCDLDPLLVDQPVLFAEGTD